MSKQSRTRILTLSQFSLLESQTPKRFDTQVFLLPKRFGAGVKCQNSLAPKIMRKETHVREDHKPKDR